MRRHPFIVRLLVTAFTMAIVPPPAGAHPHAWIDVKTTVILSRESSVTAIREEWNFDPSYTKYLLQDTKGTWKPLKEFTETAMHNLAQYGYFMELHAGGARLVLGQPVEAESKLSNGSLVMRFTVPLANSADIAKSEMVFSVYDPTYWIEFAHVKDHPISFEGPGAETCSARIKQAKPSAQALSQAQAMDRNAPVNRSLGKMFAEAVSIHCD
jgi:ABC-type uncharacterized transport system substrate-binding protein